VNRAADRPYGESLTCSHRVPNEATARTARPTEHLLLPDRHVRCDAVTMVGSTKQPWLNASSCGTRRRQHNAPPATERAQCGPLLLSGAATHHRTHLGLRSMPAPIFSVPHGGYQPFPARLSCTDASTRALSPQRCPAGQRKREQGLTTRSRSASASTTEAFLPPSRSAGHVAARSCARGPDQFDEPVMSSPPAPVADHYFVKLACRRSAGSALRPAVLPHPSA